MATRVKTGGRKKGTPNKKTSARGALIARAEKEGVTPLEVMLQAMREHYAAKRLDDAAAIAKDAAPYMHPKLSAVEHSGPGKGPIETVDRAAVLKAYREGVCDRV